MNNKNRKKNRLENYDYSQNGMYFVTICTKDRIEHFGKIINGKLIPSEIGLMAEISWKEIPNHFPYVILDEFIIMPNHIHGVIEIVGNENFRSLRKENWSGAGSRTLSSIIKGFKIGVTNWCKNNNCYFYWQKSFYDHIIRNEISLNKIREYIKINPQMWERDRNNIENIWI